ncbi:MAG: hypothetical protein ACKOZU_10865 [Planctomycetaceae bacterium]
MHDPLSEDEGCDLLARAFRARGYAIKRNVRFREYDVEFQVDGWDAKARVGFEFLSSEAHDHDDLTLGEFKRLMAAQQRGELALFIVDESEQLTAPDLAAAAEEFLDEVKAAGPRKRTARRRPAAPTTPARRKKLPRAKAAPPKTTSSRKPAGRKHR